ncbi:uncharacterized protein DUF1524 [Actinokineospora spheciospongiae]|nr:uncharacterized protein DUF1524 [Actinokineospora spheciospongiae]
MMVGIKIEAVERSVDDVFSEDYRFTIPLYQRPYAWTTEQAGELFDDLVVAASGDAPLEEVDPYFLGSIVLIKEVGKPDSQVVDGQQRLTTLALLLGALRLHVHDDFAASLDKRLLQEGDPLKGTIDQSRLTLRGNDQAFYVKHLQAPAALAEAATLSVDTLLDSQRNLLLNSRLFLERLGELSEAECTRLVLFVVQRTFLVIVSTQDFNSAFRVFTVLNERGLDLTHFDILKSEVISTIPDADRESYAKKWEEEENALGRPGFNELFSHIRMVFAKTKARGSILKEFRSAVLTGQRTGRAFIDDVLVPLSGAYATVTRADYAAPGGADAVNNLLRWLGRIDNVDWIPPAIAHLSRPTTDAASLREFLTGLERLAASMLVRRVDTTRRIERYGRVLTALETGEDLYRPDSPLQLTEAEKRDTLLRLGEDLYTAARVRLYVLRRLDAALSDSGVTYDHRIVTVEHVLPQSPAADSRWNRDFTPDEQLHWRHRLANLVLLNRRKNTAAANYDFDVKKAKYFTSVNGVSSFALTTQVLTVDEWTPSVLEERQQQLLDTLAAVWSLR